MSKSRDIADSAATINYIDNVTSDVQSQLNTLTTAIDNVSVTSGTLTKTFTTGESSTINLTSSVLAPVVSVTKEVPQSGVTNNNWDVNSTTENYTRLDSAYATTLDWAAGAINTGSYSSNNFGVTTQATEPRGMKVSSDGTKAYVVDGTTDSIYQYSLSTAFDISTASYNSVSFSVSSQTAEPHGIVFNADGTKFYITSVSPDAVYQYSLSTAFDLSTASYDSVSFTVSEDGNPYGVAFNSDGTKMYICGVSTDSVYQYSLSTAFNVSTASYDSVSFSVASGAFVDPADLTFNSSGTKMYVLSTGSDDVRQYSLSTAFDLSTASYDSLELTTAEDSSMRGMSINSSGSKIYLTGNSTDTLYEYDVPLANLALGTGSFASADVGKTIEANDGVFVLTATDGSYVETTAPTSYDQVASGSWEMYGVVYNAADGDLELSIANTGFDVSIAVYSQSFSLASQDTFPRGAAFNTDGTKMFIVGTSGDAVYEYTLSTGFDLSTAVYSQSFSILSQVGQGQGIAFNTDGTKMFITDGSGEDVSEFTLSTGFDVSTATYSTAFSITAQDTLPWGIAFNADGTKMFVVGRTNSNVLEYALTTGFSLSIASYSQSFSVSEQEAAPTGLAFNSDGTKMFVLGASGDDVNEYTLSTGFDISTAFFVDSFSVSDKETNPAGLAFSPDGTKMFVAGYTSDSIHEYDVGAVIVPTGYHPVHTTQSTDTQYWTDINSMTADQAAGDGNVYYAISTDDRTTWTVIDNTDGERDIVRNNAGTWQYNSNSAYASETWVNGATNTELATLAEAMEGAFKGYSVSSLAYSQSFSVGSQDDNPRGIAFNTNGTKMFVVGVTGQDINEYTLSTAFDVSTASFVGAFGVSSQESTPSGVTFNDDGTKMYVIGTNGDDVNEYTLSAGFDVSTASYSQNFSVSSQDTQPRDLKFNSNGTKMFVLGDSSTNSVYEYSLLTGFDVSTASFVDSFSVNSEASNPRGLAFSSTGTTMFVSDQSPQRIVEYTLSTGFDISTAIYSQSNSIVSSQDAEPNGIAFNADGSKLFMIGDVGQSVYEYTMGAYLNQMDKTQLDAVTDPNHIALGNDLDLSIIFNMTSGTTVPSSDGVAINYDANILNQGAVLGTDYNFDAPAGNKVRITAVNAANYKVRVV